MESSSSSMTVTDNDSSAEIVFDFDQGKNIILDRLLSFSPNLEFVSIIVGVDRNRKLFNVPLLDLATELFHHPSITSYFEARVLIRVFEGVSKISFRVTYHFEERSGKISHFKKGKVVFRTYYRVEEMIEEFHQALKSQRYIVVVINFAPSYDHIPNWFPEDYNSSRVIWATTCDYNHPPVHSLVQENFQLQNGITEAWEYLRDKVFADRICPLELTNQGMQIAKNCLGVRPVLDRAARLLRETEMTSYEWEYIVRSGVFQIIFRDKVFYFFGYIPRLSKGDHSFMIDEENKKKNRDPEKRIEVLHPIKKNVVEKEPENLVVGLDDDLLKIKHQLTGLPCQLEIITIVGMGGIGKTTLAKAIFADRLVQYHFYVCAWIKISQVYELRGLLLEILQNIGHLNDETGKMNTDQLKEKLRQKLKGRRFLIVMDDLWSSQAWDSMITCFPNDNNGSRILLTTQLKNLAAHASLKTAPHEMRFLDKEQSWELMRYQIFKTKICPTGLVEIGKKIAEKCRGLPLSILVTGGVLSNMSQTSDGWEKVAENLNSVLTNDPEKSLNILALSYNYLPPHLKACFLYMSAFPEDCEIDCWSLKRLWVAEGFIKEESGRNLEDLAERFLEDLVKRNLVLVGKRRSTGGIKTCQLHDTIRELSLREAQKENFMQVITRNVEVHSKGDIVSCRLSFHSGSCSSFQPDPTVELDAFLCFDVGFGSIPDIGFSLSEFNFKLLKVLDINFLRFDYFPDLILNLIHLRFLALTAACEIPSSISKLLNLQTLIVLGPWLSRKHGKIPTLPVEFWKMSQLRHLNFSAAILLTGPLLDEDDASGSVVLMNLQTLNTLRSMSCTEQLFKSLPNLKKLGIRQIKEDLDTPNGSSHFLRSLIHLHQLEKLKCSFYFQNRETMHLPELQAFPERLKKLTLNGGKFPWTEMEILGKLPKLEVLKLKEYAFQGPIWEANEGGFPSLKVLLIQKTDLEHWNADRYSFPGLQSLVLSFCESLEEIPNEIVDDMLLIELHHCSSSAERSAREIQEVQRSSGNDDLVIRIISKGQMSNAESNDP